jgi:hypothetical protein
MQFAQNLHEDASVQFKVMHHPILNGYIGIQLALNLGVPLHMPIVGEDVAMWVESMQKEDTYI